MKMGAQFLSIVIVVVIYCLTVGNIIWCIPIDNGVEGDPEIECGATGISINFNTRNPFQGHVYIKGFYNDSQCRKDAEITNTRKTVALNASFAQCGIERSRSLNPKGVFVRQAVIISFHPQEADKTVSQDLQVSDITTEFRSQNVTMPICRYEIFEASEIGGQPVEKGQLVKYAFIGQPVYHKWTCDSTHEPNIFCMRVKDCTVDDGTGNTVKLLDDDGCALDRYLLQNLEYMSDLSAGREAHVFKYADKPALIFSCQIALTVKDPGTECSRPQCKPLSSALPVSSSGQGSQQGLSARESKTVTPTALRYTAKALNVSRSRPKNAPYDGRLVANRKRKFLRQKRHVNEIEDDDRFLGIWDVRAQPLSIMELETWYNETSAVQPPSRTVHSEPPHDFKPHHCISAAYVIILYTAMLISVLPLLIIFLCYFMHCR